MRVKIFAKRGDVTKLEEEINRWLADSNLSINTSHIKQSYVYDSKDDIVCCLMSVWYDEDLDM